MARELGQAKFLQSLPELVIGRLPKPLQTIQPRQPWRWIVQFHYGEARLHYEISRAARQAGWELGFHCEARDKDLNRFLLKGFRRHLFEIKDALGQQVEAEMWDKGWTKIYEVYPERPLTHAYQLEMSQRMADFIICLHPIYVDLRNTVAQVHR